MNKASQRLLLALLTLACAARPAALDTRDVVHLEDGTSIAGLIVEQEPGRNLTVQRADGELVTLRLEQVRRIEKKISEQQGLIEYRDVVFLRDGVIFRGAIVEQVPGQTLTLELTNGRLLHLTEKEVWKIAKDRIAPRIAGSDSPDKERHEKFRVQLQIQLAREREGRLKERGGKESGGAGQGEQAADELDRLKEEVAALEREQEEAEQKLAESKERERQVQAGLDPLGELTAESLGELRRRLDGCAAPEIQEPARALYDQLDSRLQELYGRLQAVELIAATSPEAEQLRIDEATRRLTSLVRGNRWSGPKYRESFQQAVDELPPAERLAVYRQVRQKRPAKAAANNLVPVFALGSWDQGDKLGAAITSGVMSAGLALLAAGAVPSSTYDAGAGESETSLSLSPLGWVGLGTIAAGYAYSIIEPFFFTSRVNRRLAEALQISDLGAGAEK